MEKCKCGTELTFIEKSNCMRCLKCNPIVERPVREEKEVKLLDVKMTEGRVREIVRDELENWHIDKLGPSRDAINKALERLGDAEELPGEAILAETDLTDQPAGTLIPKGTAIGRSTDPPDWRAQAKSLGIPLNQPTGGARKKKDVLADIESAMN